MNHARFIAIGLAAFLIGAADGCATETVPADTPPCTIVVPKGASYAETLAAKEVRRYVYLRMGRLLPIIDTSGPLPEKGDLIRVETLQTAPEALPPEGYFLKTALQENRRVLTLGGGNPTTTLYAAYRFAERLGVRFYLEGDVIPDAKIPFALPDLNETAKPLFETRGIQPFHDFPEGPDWWNLDDYKAYISQLVKLRMNFIGLHTYPEGHPIAEPTVWIGLPQDIGDGAKVKFSYPTSWQNTLLDSPWGYKAKKTSEFSFGAADLFDRDDFGADVMRGFCPQPSSPEACNELFDRAGAMLAEAFKHARRLGVKTCVGTETPLTIPKAVQEHLKALGKDPADKAVVQELYEGIFKRLAQIGPPDYYWFWTPEGWTWGNVDPEQVQATLDDLAAAVATAKKIQAPFTLATCGWVLGPQNDRALFDKTLPKNMPMSCINREVGKAPVEPGFAKVTGRPKWAIPWMEDDPNLGSVQLWVGRMRKDAADALKYGCTGLLGIHWRTRVLGPNVSALAQAAWDQSGWNQSVAAPPDLQEGPEGGQVAAFPQNAIAGTDDPTLYQTVRYNLSAYRFNLPAGKYTVRLQFCEPHYQEAGKRIFGVRIQDKQVIENLDIFAKVGPNKALDYTFKDVEVSGGGLTIAFVPETEFPSIAAIAVEGPGGTKKVNCGGPAYKDYAADPPVAGPSTPRDRFLPTADFYRDWALAQFGPEVADRAAAIFEKVDGHMPEATGWIEGPGGINPNNNPVDEVLKAYAFVGDLEKLRPEVRGAGNLERFDYWLSNFRYMIAVERLKCAWAKKDEAAMKQALADLHRHLLATVTTPGELGTVANWQQHNLHRLNLTDLETAYRGPMRIVVPTVRTSLDAGETLNLRVLILAEKPPTQARVFVRPLGKGEFTRVPLAHVARGVYSAPITPPGGGDFEYYVEAVPPEGDAARWPVTAPETCQTVVVTN